MIRRTRSLITTCALSLLAVLAVGQCNHLKAADGQMLLEVVDADLREPIPCRMTLETPQGRNYHPPRTTFWAGQFVVPGEMRLRVGRGTWRFTLARGPEYLNQKGHFIIELFADDSKQVELQRFINMAERGWWSGDLDVRRPLREMPLLMASEDLHVAQVITWPRETLDPGLTDITDGSPLQAVATTSILSPGGKKEWPDDADRWFHVLSGELKTPGGTFHCFNLPTRPESVTPDGFRGATSPEYPSVEQFLDFARENSEVWVDASRPYDWDVPTLVACGLLDSVQVMNGDLTYQGVKHDDSRGFPRDSVKYPQERDVARYGQDIYFKLLECGIRIAPSAGSGSGVSPNPVGFNRVYVHLGADQPFSYDSWWQALREGRAMLTNGPMLLVSAEGQPPGHVFRSPDGSPLQIVVTPMMMTKFPVSYIEIIRNGQLLQSIRIKDLVESMGRGEMPALTFDESGWFLVRVVSDDETTYRYAMTAPFYVEIGEKRRISRSAAAFFLDWVTQRAAQIKLTDPQESEAVMQYHRRARDFYQKLIDEATVD